MVGLLESSPTPNLGAQGLLNVWKLPQTAYAPTRIYGSQGDEKISHSFTLKLLYVLFLQGKPDYGFDCRTEEDKQGHVVAVHGYSAHILHTLMDLLHFK